MREGQIEKETSVWVLVGAEHLDIQYQFHWGGGCEEVGLFEVS